MDKNLAYKWRMGETKKEVRCYVYVFGWKGKIGRLKSNKKKFFN